VQTVDILVLPDMDATITPTGSYCIANLPVNLSAVDPGGNWSGNGITNAAAGTFDPALAGIGTHTITYTIAGQCGDVQTTNIVVNAMDDATITPVGPYCVTSAPVVLSAATAGGIWSGNGITNPGSGAFNPSSAGPGTHTITYVTGGVCSSTGTVMISVNPLPNVTFTADTLGLCETPQQAFTFTNTTDTTGGMVGSTLWDFGDNSTGTGNVVSHAYAGPGSYTITLTVTSTVGAGSCSNYLDKTNYVQVFANPTANFSMDPSPTTVFDPTVNFNDLSYNNIVAWNWNIGGLITSTQQNPSYTFPEDIGEYFTTLFVTDINGCVDSTSGTAIVKGEYGVFIPNSFTPDDDNLNDGFSPQGYGVSQDNYSFLIFDRWGELIYESHKTFEPWNGNYKGKLVPNGVYVWKLYFTDINGLQHEKVGHVNIVR